MGYIGVITHLLAFDPNFQRDILVVEMLQCFSTPEEVTTTPWTPPALRSFAPKDPVSFSMTVTHRLIERMEKEKPGTASVELLGGELK